MTPCGQPGCSGTIQDGFCDECGLAPAAADATAAQARSAPSVRGLTGVTSVSGRSRRGSSRSSSRSTRTARTSRGRLGAGLIEMPKVAYRDPSTAIMADPQVAEHERFCSNCGNPVGRGREGVAGRTEGFCRQCGTAYSFTPKLSAGDLVAGQYEVLGCIAHGGLGWIYLARDRNVSDRWVVLKGLLDTGDSEAMAAAVAERQFLATVEHPNIVKIYNFVHHPDPKTSELVSYIVMEYIGGASLKELRSARGADGEIAPLPVAEALAYILEILPAIGYLHGLGLLYCDFKPDNVIQTEEQLKLIDLGAVRRMDDEDSGSYKTDGYCAPELETEGASVESDVFTIGRSLALLTFNFDYRNRYRYELPDAADVRVLADNPGFHRLLSRATAADSGHRFGSAAEMAEQVTGVLREVVAIRDGVPRPAMSTVFSSERAVFGAEAREKEWPVPLRPVVVATALPVPMVDPQDPAASFLATTSVPDPHRLVATLEAAPVSSLEMALSLARARIEAGDIAGAAKDLDALEESEDADWRITWYRGLAALATGDAPAARGCFDTILDLLPGEGAAKLALAAAEESVGNVPAAALLYERVWRTDHSYTSAAFGLARTRLACNDFGGAVAALDSVPESSSYYTAARLAAIRARIADLGPADRAELYLVDAGERVATLELDTERKALTSIGVLDAARALVTAQPAGQRSGATVLGYRLDERSVRRGLEQQYRTLARLARDKESRLELVNRANSARPVTWI